MKYEVVVEEVVSGVFEIDANTAKEAISKAINMYKSDEIILSPGNLEHKQLAIIKPNNEELNWVEF